MKKFNWKFSAGSFLAILVAGVLFTDEIRAQQAQYSIKQIMTRAHKGNNSFASRAKSGKASVREIQYLLSLYRSMVYLKPPKGNVSAWRQKSVALIRATEGLLRNPRSTAAYSRAVDCNGCHNAHK